MKDRSFHSYFLIASILGGLVIAAFAFNLPTWSEEQGWLKIGKLIAVGERLNPIAPKSDYPSSFQAFPIGLLIAAGLQPIAASRLTAIIFAVIAAYFFGRISEVISKGNSSASFAAMIMSLLTYNTAFYVMTGWHEVTHVNLLCGATTFYLLSLLYDETRNVGSAIPFGVFLSLCLWTLYTPAVFSCSIIFVLCLLPSHLISWRLKSYTLVAMALTTIPLLAELMNSNWEWLHRHYLWIVEGGEWENTKYSSQNLFSAAMLRALRLLISMLVPQGAGDNWNSSIGIFPEWTLALIALIGIVASFKDMRKFIAITVPCIVTTVILVLSNPTPWRASILGFYVLLYAVLGLEVLNCISRGKPRIFLFGALLVLHLFFFFMPLKQFFRSANAVFADGRIAKDIASECGELLATGTIVAHDFYGLILLEAGLNGTDRFRFMKRDTSIQELLESQAETAIILSENKNLLENAALLPHQVVCNGFSTGFAFWVISIQK